MSLLTIPAEVRLRIYHYLFGSSTLEAYGQSEETRHEPNLLVSICGTQVPRQVTFTCQVLRQESAPLLLPSTSLHYYTGPANLTAKEIARSLPLEPMRRIQILKIEYENFFWKFPFYAMPALQEVHIQSSPDLPAMDIRVAIEDAILWLQLSQPSTLVAKVKGELQFDFGDGSGCGLDSEVRRGAGAYTITWSEALIFRLEGEDDMDIATRLSFDWDTELVPRNDTDWKTALQELVDTYDDRHVGEDGAIDDAEGDLN